MSCFEDSEDENMLMAKGVSTVLLRLIESNQGRLMQWQCQHTSNSGNKHGSDILLSATDVITTNANVINHANVMIGGCNTTVPVIGRMPRFDSAYVPEISVEDYVERVQTYSKCSASVYVIAMVYIDRLIEGEGLVLVCIVPISCMMDVSQSMYLINWISNIPDLFSIRAKKKIYIAM